MASSWTSVKASITATEASLLEGDRSFGSGTSDESTSFISFMPASNSSTLSANLSMIMMPAIAEAVRIAALMISTNVCSTCGKKSAVIQKKRYNASQLMVIATMICIEVRVREYRDI